METFQYGQKEIDYLKKKDKKLAAAIDRIGMLSREVQPDIFQALVRGIVAQQISTKAAITIYKRLEDAAGSITPENIHDMDVEKIHKCGMFTKKAIYIKGIAEAIIIGSIDLDSFPDLSDEEIVKKLTAINGIGVWTAEMILIFSMQRSNVLSWGDLAIRRSIIKLYGLKELDKAKFDVYKKRYSPYGSVASLYLWEISVDE